MNPVAAVLLGVTTAVGGGLLRDITANEVPQLFDARDLYALPAFPGAALDHNPVVAGCVQRRHRMRRGGRGVRVPRGGLAPVVARSAGCPRMAPAGPGTRESRGRD